MESIKINKKFIEYKTEEGKDFSEEDELSEGLVLIAQFEDIKKRTNNYTTNNRE